MIEIEVVYATVQRQVLRTFAVPQGTTVRAALAASGIADEFPELDLATCPVGIFSKVIADPERQAVQAGDRLEIYRPLLADPKEIRRLRAAKAAEARKQNQ
ncbi:RnfH family protein [Pseudomonas mediterranea]|uniref:RnfH family protein n=1 Tax=Pseudomonas mediterranea TaxID=183795 RepID=UPI00052F89CA|nr:RnfH family protein [Pseudomonas mediterranea]KGU86651.1 protein RnfH [Pseudomonas mediterranea CFBP 5447]MBL0840782.1 RnfH family protein [Pseudomonas mediterranea]MDU9030547.1 RnfH family protein [Pseudomonas mediterranea]QHA80845.1 RnfH family protein [Pseudomonas mediterranea]UZE01745.1 RnfH family protein [Pseudomonas mediterranea]